MYIFIVYFISKAQPITCSLKAVLNPLEECVNKARRGVGGGEWCCSKNKGDVTSPIVPLE